MTPLEWVGAIVAVLVALGIAGLGLGYFGDIVVKHFSQWLWRMAESRIKARAQQMKHQQYWFSNPEHAAMWLACAEHMADGDYPEPERIRDRTYPAMLQKVLEQRKPLRAA